MEITETIKKETTCWQEQSQINIKDLCKIEISIIASMFHSPELFSKITELINEENFTFMVNKKIFKYLRSYSNEVDFYRNEDEKINIAREIYIFENIFVTTTLRILDSIPSQNIDLDLAEFLDFNKKRLEVFEKNSDSGNYDLNIVIEDEYGECIALYYNGIIKEIETIYIFNLPDELCDTFKYTFENIIQYTQKENFNLTMEINENDPKDIRAFILTKEINKIEKIEKLIKWGKENQLKQSLFPRNRGNLLNVIIFKLDYQNLENIPDEFCEALHQVRVLSLRNNKIKKIPQNINLLKNCVFLGLGNNQIEFLPNTLFQLTKLSILCLHGNKLKKIPDAISNLVELKSLTLSNNSITNFPSTISHLANLKELDIENTLIDESSLKYIHLENIEKISFDDRLLPYLIENFHLLKKINTINLNHSKYKIDNPIFSSLKLNIETENWMEDQDYNGNGCIVLKRIFEL